MSERFLVCPISKFGRCLEQLTTSAESLARRGHLDIGRFESVMPCKYLGFRVAELAQKAVAFCFRIVFDGALRRAGHGALPLTIRAHRVQIRARERRRLAMSIDSLSADYTRST